MAGGRKKGLIFWRERSLPPAFFLLFQKNALLYTPIDNQNSIRTGIFLLSVCCFFVVLTFPSVACFRCRQPSLYRRERGKVFGLNTLCLQRKILPETALSPDLAAAIKPCATLASEHREQVADGMDFNYTIGCSLCHRKETMSSETLSWWRRFYLLRTF